MLKPGGLDMDMSLAFTALILVWMPVALAPSSPAEAKALQPGRPAPVIQA
jgi:hypothetical protein